MTDINRVLDILFDELNNKLLDMEGVYVAVGDTDDFLKLLEAIKSKFTNIGQIVHLTDRCVVVRLISDTKINSFTITPNTRLRGFKQLGNRPTVLITDSPSMRLRHKCKHLLKQGKYRTYFLENQTGQQ